MIWSDKAILEAIEAGNFAATPWHAKDLTPNGLDLRISHVLIPSQSEEPQTEGTVTVPPMTRFVVGTEATLQMPNDAVGSLWIRSSYARRGVLAAFGKVDAGFHGNLTVGAFHSGHEPLEIPIGDRFCQIVLESMGSPAEQSYAERSGNYQGQSGVTLAK